MAADARAAAARCVERVLRGRRSLSEVAPAGDSLARELSYGALRHGPRLQAVLSALLDRPAAGVDADLCALMMVGMYQLSHTRVPSHAAVHETVAACETLGKAHAKPLVNGVLRNYQRKAAELDARLSAAERDAHPGWLHAALRARWPAQAGEIIAANNGRPPMTLRVNRRRADRAGYLARLRAAGIDAVACATAVHGVTLRTPVGVRALPGFDEGAVSVQDASAQLAAPALRLGPGLRLLDACAAPGGKLAHCLEREPGLARCTALDRSATRLAKLRDGLSRLGLDGAEIVRRAAEDTDDWWDGVPYDRVLLDAPCSGSGIIRRRPDIKALRTAADVSALARAQGRLLEALWPCVAPGGLLLYSVCSVLPEEGDELVSGFVDGRADARCARLGARWGVAQRCGRQRLPSTGGGDGFYYALLERAFPA